MTRKNLLSLLFLLFLLNVASLGQSQYRKLVWSTISETHNLPGNYFLQFDFTTRSDDQVRHLQTIFLRPGLGYRLKNGVGLAAGFNYSLSRIVINEVAAYKAEKQIWQQQTYRWTRKSFQLLERVLTEERFIPETALENGSITVKSNRFSFRSRFFTKAFWHFNSSIPINSGNYAYAQQEVFINLTGLNAVNGRHFDQMRLALGVGHHFKQFDSEIGLMQRNVLNRNGSHFNDLIVQINHFLRF